MMRRALAFLSVVTLVLLAVATPSAYVHLVQGQYGRWPGGATLTMYLQMPLTGGGTLIDGGTSWNAVTARAVSDWNYWLGSIDFVSRAENRTRVRGNEANDVFFSDDVYGDAFGANVLAVTAHLVRAGQTIEADVLFNNAKSWNSYRGPVRSGLTDLRRVALHEFGHVLLLDHPDEAGESVDAIMNHATDDTADLQVDDVQGARTLYPYGNPPQAPAASFALPSRTEAIDFRHAM